MSEEHSSQAMDGVIEHPRLALEGAETGHLCDRCNRRIQTGDLARGYATWYEGDGWVLRRVWCEQCGATELGRGTDGTDEVIVEATFWKHQLISVLIRDRCNSRTVAEA